MVFEVSSERFDHEHNLRTFAENKAGNLRKVDDFEKIFNHEITRTGTKYRGTGLFRDTSCPFVVTVRLSFVAAGLRSLRRFRLVLGRGGRRRRFRG